MTEPRTSVECWLEPAAGADRLFYRHWPAAAPSGRQARPGLIVRPEARQALAAFGGLSEAAGSRV